MVILEASDLHKEFVEKNKILKAVDGVSFCVNKGEIFGFLGPNGAGKSTTINMLCTLAKPTSGTGMINGYDILKQPDGVRQSIGMVFQEPSLDEMLTAWENMDFHARLYNMPGKKRAKSVEQMLKMVDLYDRKDDLVKTFSGGMKRRLELARGLTHSPKVLFLDEPTLGLDPQTRNYMWEYILKLREDDHLTIFLTTHYMDEAEHCDRIAVIDNGRIICLDTPANLKEKVSGDIVSIVVDDPELAGVYLKELGLTAHFHNGGISFEVEHGGEFLPKFLKDVKFEIHDISLRRPTLDDVFLHRTGKRIREEHVDGLDMMRSHARMMRR